MDKKIYPYVVGKGLTYLSVALFFVFLILKLAGLVAWSWWLICAPFLLPLGFCVFIVLLAMYLVSQKSNG